jgi:hypothetical protein
MAVKAVNNTAGPNGLVPTLLVYRAYPRMGKLDPPAPSVMDRAAAIRKAVRLIYGPLEGRIVHFTDDKQDLRSA